MVALREKICIVKAGAKSYHLKRMDASQQQLMKEGPVDEVGCIGLRYRSEACRRARLDAGKHFSLARRL